MPEASPAFRALVSLLGEALGGPPMPASVVGPAVAMLAQHRHGVGPLLHQAADNGRHTVASVLMMEMERDYRRGAGRRVEALARLEKLGMVFAAEGLRWLTFKGPAQSAWLYPDPARRQSMDMDVLVNKADFVRAVMVLEKSGYAARFPSLPRWGFLRRLVLALTRDLTFIANDDSTCSVDLHRRLFVAAPGWELPLGSEGLPTPGPGPELALYLLAHGAVSYWVRLRWMTDLVLLLPRLRASDWDRLQELARQHGLEASAAASLLMLRSLFPFVAMGTTESWLAAQALRRPVRQRLSRYTAMVTCDDLHFPSPLNHAWFTFQANWLLCDRIGARLRLLLLAPLSSAAKRLTALA